MKTLKVLILLCVISASTYSIPVHVTVKPTYIIKKVKPETDWDKFMRLYFEIEKRENSKIKKGK